MKKANILNEKYTVTKTGKAKLIDALVNSVVLAIVVYAIVGPLNADAVKLLELVSKNDLAFETAMLFLPISFIVNLSIAFGCMTMKKK